MSAKLSYLWHLVRDSYWFVPGLMTIGGIALSFAVIELDRRTTVEVVEKLGWIYTGGAEGAREVLAVIAGSMITVAGVVFSITIVALALASSQFGPRVLANFMRDTGNQVVLGVFIATFLYSLLVLRTIRAEDGDAAAVVPAISVTVALVLALASLVVLIYFIHHVSISIQAPHVVATIAAELRHGIAEMFPEGKEAASARRQDDNAPDFDRAAMRITAPETGYLEAVDFDAVMKIAIERDIVVRLEYRAGHFINSGGAVARAWPAARMDDETVDAIAGSFVVGTWRTSIQDIEFPIHQLAEIAVRALSPGINDPFTAMNCIDQLGAGVAELAERRFPAPERFDENGTLRMVIARPFTFGGLVEAAFDQIRQNAAHHAAVHIRLLESLERVVERVSSIDRLEPILRQADLVLERSRDEVASAADRHDVEDRYDALRAAADGRRHSLNATS
jgi:uncharacterized membrane protein